MGSKLMVVTHESFGFEAKVSHIRYLLSGSTFDISLVGDGVMSCMINGVIFPVS